MIRRGTSQVPNAQSITDKPAITACVAAVSGLDGSVRADAAPVDREPPGVDRRQQDVGRDPGGQQDPRQPGRAVKLHRPRHDARGHHQGENARVRVTDDGP